MSSALFKKHKCILFDCDNVLVDTETIMLSVLIELVKEFGVEMTIDEAIERFCGQQMKMIISDLESISNAKLPADFESQYRAIAYKRFKKELQPKDGVKELLSKITIPFCVASNGPRNKIELNLGLTGLLPFFTPERIFSAYDVNHWKPDPKLYLHAATSMGFLPSECAIIEDSIPGVEAGIRGGFTVYALSNESSNDFFNEQGAIIFHNMQELGGILNL